MIQSHFLNITTGQKSALMELAVNQVVVVQYRGTESGVAIQIEPTDLYSDGQVLHGCKLVFKVAIEHKD